MLYINLLSFGGYLEVNGNKFEKFTYLIVFFRVSLKMVYFYKGVGGILLI